MAPPPRGLRDDMSQQRQHISIEDVSAMVIPASCEIPTEQVMLNKKEVGFIHVGCKYATTFDIFRDKKLHFEVRVPSHTSRGLPTSSPILCFIQS